MLSFSYCQNEIHICHRHHVEILIRSLFSICQMNFQALSLWNSKCWEASWRHVGWLLECSISVMSHQYTIFTLHGSSAKELKRWEQVLDSTSGCILLTLSMIVLHYSLYFLDFPPASLYSPFSFPTFLWPLHNFCLFLSIFIPHSPSLFPNSVSNHL